MPILVGSCLSSTQICRRLGGRPNNLLRGPWNCCCCWFLYTSASAVLISQYRQGIHFGLTLILWSNLINMARTRIEVETLQFDKFTTPKEATRYICSIKKPTLNGWTYFVLVCYSWSKMKLIFGCKMNSDSVLSGNCLRNKISSSRTSLKMLSIQNTSLNGFVLGLLNEVAGKNAQ